MKNKVSFIVSIKANFFVKILELIYNNVTKKECIGYLLINLLIMTFTKSDISRMEERKAEIAISLYRGQTKNISPNKACFNHI